MRKISRILAACATLLLATGALTGCSSDYKNTVGETANNLPKVSGTFNQSAAVDPGKGTPPKNLQSVVIIQGKGKKVTEASTVKVQYLLQMWDGKAVPGNNTFDTKKPISFGLNQVITGWKEALVNKNVGDRVLIVVPPDKGYGKAGAPPAIPPNATLVFVVDILDAN